MEAATCGHTPDNNKNALYGVLSVSLIASVAVAVVQGILIAYAADVASLAYFAALVAVCVGKIVGLCLGLAGTSMANSSLLVAVVVFELLWIAASILGPEALFILGVVARGGYVVTPLIVSMSIFPLDTALVGLLTSALVLAFQARANIIRFNYDSMPECAHSKDNNQSVLTGILSTALAVTVVYGIALWFSGYGDLGIIVYFSSHVLSLASIIVGLIGNCAPLSPSDRANCFLAFFILQILHQLIGLGFSFVSLLISSSVNGLTIVLALASMICLQFAGPIVTLALQSRAQLTHTGTQYIPLASNVH